MTIHLPTPGTVVPALTVLQPYAWLLAGGFKRNETRWSNLRSQADRIIGKWLAIHAGKSWDLVDDIIDVDVWRELDAIIAPALGKHWPDDPNSMPRGVVVAIARVVAVHDGERIIPSLTKREFLLGGYGHRRIAIELDHLHQLVEPVPARGLQGMWSWTVPDNVHFQEVRS